MVSYHDTSIDFSEVFHPLDQSRINLHQSLSHSVWMFRSHLAKPRDWSMRDWHSLPKAAHRDQSAKTPQAPSFISCSTPHWNAGVIFGQIGIDSMKVKMVFGISSQCVLVMVALETDWMQIGSLWWGFTLGLGEVVTWPWWLAFDPMGKVSVWLKLMFWAIYS